MGKIILAALATIVACSTQKTEQARPLIQVRHGAGTVYNTSKEAGERALHHLARTAKLEDYWIFSKNQWIDVGTNERPEAVEGDYDVFKRCAEGTITEYHIHPIGDGRIYPPSAKDIIRHGNLKRGLKAIGVDLESRVYDGIGEWTYTVTGTVEQLLKIKRFRLYNNVYEELLREFIKQAMTNTLDAEHSSRDDRIKSYMQEVSALGILLDYRKLR